MTKSRLGAFQQEILEAFFELAPAGFFLTGGAALVGFHLGHRTTEDLDFFTSDDQLDEGAAALRAAAERRGAELDSVQTSPYLRRFLLRRGEASVLVDLVRDPGPQGTQEKRQIGTIRLDSPEEILANKLGTLLQRAELRDLVDVRALELAGYSIEAALPLAMLKDAGLTPAQLAWVLSSISIGDDAPSVGGIDAVELRRYLESLTARLARLGAPG